MALANEKQVIEYAKALDQSADTARKKLNFLIADGKIESSEARRAARKISAMRDEAVFISLEAMHLWLDNLQTSQRELLDTMKAAKEKLEAIQAAGGFLSLLSSMVVLSAAIAGGKPGSILAALRDVHSEVSTRHG